MKKRIWSILLALCMVLSLLPFGTLTASAADASDLSYQIVNDTVMITGCSQEASGALTIPATIEGYPVTGIGHNAFMGRSKLTSVTIPASVISIDRAAFLDCRSLASVTISYGVTSIDELAFSGCSSLTSITIPDSVTSIGNSAFSYCSSLASVTISESVTSIEWRTFSSCSSLTSVTIPAGVTSIRADAFSGCSSLTSIEVAAGNPSFRSMDGVLFSKDTKTLIRYPGGKSGSYQIPQGVTSVGENAFSGCISLTSVKIPDSVTSIGMYAFSGCKNLVGAAIPDGVTSIGGSAFSGCSSLTSVRIPNSVTSIGGNAFYNCSSLASVTIPYGVASIGEEAFSGCSSLASVTIPDSVISIGKDAFTGTKLADASNWTDGILYIGPALIDAKDDVTSCVIKDGTRLIADRAFFLCSSLTSVTIPAGVTSIGSLAFDGCSSLTSVAIPNSVTSIGSAAFSGCSSVTSVMIPNSVTSIGQQAFFDCSSLTSVEIPGSVTSIGRETFYRCSSLQEAKIAEGVAEIQDEAFRDCSSLKRVELPNSVTTIGYDAFLNSDLTSVTIPASVTSIGAGAFSACKDLTAILVEESSPAYCSVGGGLLSKDQKTMVCYPAGKTGAYGIPESVTVIESAAFSKCTGLTGVTIPNGVTVIDGNTFYGCTGLTDITIPEGVTGIFYMAFYGCENLRDVTFPLSLQEISFGTFAGCGIKDIWYAGTEEQWYAIQSWAYGDDDGFFGTGAAEHYNAHTHTDLTAFAAVAATCTKDGTGAYWKCNTCGKLFSDVLGKYEIAAPAAVPAAGHKWDGGKVIKEPTETAEGAKTVTCTVCGETETQAIPKLAHTHDLTAVAAVAASCTKGGTEAYWKCSKCGRLFSDAAGKNEIAAPAAVPATGHRWDGGRVTKEPTETAEGVKTFTCTVCGEKRTEAIAKLTPKPVENPFTDVPADQYYYEPVLWAVNHDPQITNGTGDNTFSPDATCTRGQIVTFLWRAKGCPEPKSTVNPFTDVKESDYFYKAILWANENDVTNGTGDGTFSPEAPCTRAHVVTFLWRAEGKPAAGGSNPFRDVPAGQYYTEAVLWAVNHDPQITNGTGPDTFGPNDPCTRGQIVTFLYRDMK